MRELRSPRLTQSRNWLIAAAIPTALVVGASAAPAVAQNSLPGLSSSGFSDNIRPSDPPKRTPIEVDRNPQIPGLPAGVSVDRIEWLTNRRVAVFIKSAAMPEQLMQVQILLARDWHSNPEATFPEVWALDGLRARDDENGWTIETNIEQFYADKNVNVVLPVGGESSFYSDWQRPNNGKNYKWETFLTKELVPILDNEFRSNGKRAVVGLSMGGTAAMNLAERTPTCSTSSAPSPATWTPPRRACPRPFRRHRWMPAGTTPWPCGAQSGRRTGSTTIPSWASKTSRT